MAYEGADEDEQRLSQDIDGFGAMTRVRRIVNVSKRVMLNRRQRRRDGIVVK